MPQNYENHIRINYGYYISTGLPILLLIGIGIYMIIMDTERSVGWIALLTGYILLTMLFRSRKFALMAQDRAIRAEESLRYYVLTGKRLDTRLSIGQITALRFASDEEFPLLIERTLHENLDNKSIKKAIRNWRPDHYRV